VITVVKNVSICLLNQIYNNNRKDTCIKNTIILTTLLGGNTAQGITEACENSAHKELMKQKKTLTTLFMINYKQYTSGKYKDGCLPGCAMYSGSPDDGGSKHL
jgi:hypothetical protein